MEELRRKVLAPAGALQHVDAAEGSVDMLLKSFNHLPIFNSPPPSPGPIPISASGTPSHAPQAMLRGRIDSAAKKSFLHCSHPKNYVIPPLLPPQRPQLSQRPRVLHRHGSSRPSGSAAALEGPVCVLKPLFSQPHSAYNSVVRGQSSPRRRPPGENGTQEAAWLLAPASVVTIGPGSNATPNPPPREQAKRVPPTTMLV